VGWGFALRLWRISVVLLGWVCFIDRCISHGSPLLLDLFLFALCLVELLCSVTLRLLLLLEHHLLLHILILVFFDVVVLVLFAFLLEEDLPEDEESEGVPGQFHYFDHHADFAARVSALFGVPVFEGGVEGVAGSLLPLPMILLFIRVLPPPRMKVFLSLSPSLLLSIPLFIVFREIL